MSEVIDAVVIGAGVVGLAVARALAQSGREVIVLEKNHAIGMETSSRSSEVIHAGIYYTPGSLKAHLCLRGRDSLYQYCAAKGIAHQRYGKVIVAVTAQQEVQLERLESLARANGVDDVRRIDGRELRTLEPAVVGTAGLLSPSTGIVDSHGLMLALQGDLEEAGGHVALRSHVVAGQYEPDAVRLTIASEGETTVIGARTVINAAGLHSIEVAKAIEGLSNENLPRMYYAKGNYFTYQGRSPFKHLVYPLPEEGGLGVHATMDLAGRTRFGPDVEWSESIDYALDPGRAEAFYIAVRRYWPGLPDNSLSPGHVGIRAKLSGRGETPADFVVKSMGEGSARIIHLFGIESPGLTSSLALGEYVRDL